MLSSFARRKVAQASRAPMGEPRISIRDARETGLETGLERDRIEGWSPWGLRPPGGGLE